MISSSFADPSLLVPCPTSAPSSSISRILEIWVFSRGRRNMATAAAAIILLPGRQRLPATIMRFSRRLNASSPVFLCSYSSSSASRKQLILYSKPGCCLCDGLKEKLHSAFSLASPSPDSYSLHDVELQVGSIRPYEIPVLARIRSDGTEIFNVERNHPSW